MIMEDVSERIRVLLLERGLSPYELSMRCQPFLSRSSVYNAVKGKKRVTVDTIDIICKGLEISLSDFFRFSDAAVLNLTDDERTSVDIYRHLDKVRQNRFRGYLQALQDEMNNSRE